ncbi:hypothetical protein [Prosthecobacter sp.]|uniref:hypothetical protein n=1 Tax=Prosthecobacter sp. TaxID=1965333 RepID=UPI0037843932
MIRPHTPKETPAGKPARGGDGGGAWTSPWGLDQEWHDAPPAKKSRKFEESGDETVPARRPEPESPTKAHTPSPRAVEAAPRAFPQPSRQPSPQRQVPLPTEREASWGTLIILCMGLLAFVFIAWIYIEDENPGFDEDLLFRPPVDQAQTIRTPEKLKKFLASLASFQNAVPNGRPPWLWDTPTLSRIVQSNGAALDNLRDLLEDPDWHPNHSAWHAEDVCGDARWHQALLLKQVEAAYLSRRQLEEEAFTAAIDLAEIGWRLEQIHAWPSCYQRSLDAQTLAAQTLADLLRQTKLPEATLRQFQRQFSVCQPTREMLLSALNAFYVHEKKLILGPESKELADTMPGGAQLKRPGRLFFKPHETVRLFATAFRQLKDDAKAPLAQTSDIRLKDAPAVEGSLQPNSEGRLYFMRRMKTYTPLPAFLDLVRTRGNLIVTLFAIRRCIAEKKTLPATLEQLRAFNYLLDVPIDPYTSAPLQYNLTRGLLWSVGNDLKSAGGIFSEPPMNDATEPTLEIGIAVAGAVK